LIDVHLFIANSILSFHLQVMCIRYVTVA
jgi:hypothetical protein